MSDKVTVIEFVTQVAPYRAGERAGFSHHQSAEYLRRGYAKVISEGVDVVDPRTREHDAMRRAAELRQLAQSAEAEATYHRSQADRGQART